MRLLTAGLVTASYLLVKPVNPYILAFDKLKSLFSYILADDETVFSDFVLYLCFHDFVHLASFWWDSLFYSL